MSTKHPMRPQSAKVRSTELISTLAELETAIQDWENATHEPANPPKREAPQIAQSLLKKLRQQIDEFNK